MAILKSGLLVTVDQLVGGGKGLSGNVPYSDETSVTEWADFCAMYFGVSNITLYYFSC